MLQIGICDDNREARLALRWALERLLEKRGTANNIYEFSTAEGLLRWQESHAGELGLLFLDIEMDGVNGMEAARRLRSENADLQLVFVTGYPDYVYDGYSVGALGYLLKPVKPQQLAEVVARAQAALQRGEAGVFLCRSGESYYRIPKRKILYFASDRRQIQCVTAVRCYTFYGKLDEVQQRLADLDFVRIHQRYLVYAPAVERVDVSEVLLAGGAALPISRSYQSTALAALTRALLK